MIAALLALLLGGVEVGQPGADCAGAVSQNDLNQCTAREFDLADAELNAAWREAVAGQRAFDREIDRKYDDRPSGEAKLREAQRAWLIFRDAHCTVAAYEARGGSMEPMLYNGCRARITRERTEQLRPLPSER